MIRNPPLIKSRILSRFEASKFPERLERISAGYLIFDRRAASGSLISVKDFQNKRMPTF